MDPTIITNIIIIENIVCLNISTFILFFCLFFTMALYNFTPLTPIAKTDGIYKIFCNDNAEITKINPLVIPNIFEKKDIVTP